MTTIVKVPLSNAHQGDTADSPVLYVEVDSAPTLESAWDADNVRGTRGEKAVTVVTNMIDDAVELARACAAKFNAGLAGLKEAPDEVSVELGITMDAEFGAVLARARAGAQLQVTLKWQRQE